jgi:hypothetical protein
LLTLWPFDDSLGGLVAKFGRVVFAIRKVDLKIVGDFVGVMSCEKTPRDIDLLNPND